MATLCKPGLSEPGRRVSLWNKNSQVIHFRKYIYSHKSAGVVVADGLGISESLQQRIGLQDDVFNMLRTNTPASAAVTTVTVKYWSKYFILTRIPTPKVPLWSSVYWPGLCLHLRTLWTRSSWCIWQRLFFQLRSHRWPTGNRLLQLYKVKNLFTGRPLRARQY